jgi:shikimate dehydrogenase
LADLFYKLGLIGHPVSHSLSPLMHRAALSFCQRQGSYDLIDLPPPLSHGDLLSTLERGYAGLNVTIPHKQSVVAYMDRLTSDAANIKAVNTIRVEPDGTLIGHNTDLGGFVAALEQILAHTEMELLASPIGKPALVLGAGGAARAALWGLSRFGFEPIFVMARDLNQAEIMLEEYRASCGDRQRRSVKVVSTSDVQSHALARLAILVNTIPLGVTVPDVPQWVVHALHRAADDVDATRRCIVYDMVYGRGRKTELAGLAETLGLRAFDGLSMLINQAALAFEYWTRCAVEPGFIEAAVAAHFAESV